VLRTQMTAYTLTRRETGSKTLDGLSLREALDPGLSGEWTIVDVGG
jgi:hypothetical protein